MYYLNSEWATGGMEGGAARSAPPHPPSPTPDTATHTLRSAHNYTVSGHI